jgi:hypothetical protein
MFIYKNDLREEKIKIKNKWPVMTSPKLRVASMFAG